MTHSEDNSNSSRKPWENARNRWNEQDYFSWARTPGINPMKVATVVAGLAIFPPLGVAALLYFVWKNRQYRGWDMYSPAYAGGPGNGGFGPRGHHRCGGRGRGRWTGNTAFDEHQAGVMQNLRAEREAFWNYRQEQRRKRDQEAFDAFRAAQTATPPEAPKAE